MPSVDAKTLAIIGPNIAPSARAWAISSRQNRGRNAATAEYSLHRQAERAGSPRPSHGHSQILPARRQGGEVNEVNAPLLRSTRLKVTESRESNGRGDFAELIELTATGEGAVQPGRARSSDQQPRIVKKSMAAHVESAPRGRALIYENKDRPGMSAGSARSWASTA
jgi:hypothetical protein